MELERKYKEDDRDKAPRRTRAQKAEKVQKLSGKEAGQPSGAKKPIISVVLTAHEAIPGDLGRRELGNNPVGRCEPRAAPQCPLSGER